MSIRVMSKVWDRGPSDKGELLILLALADYADEQGQSWPALSSIADKARMSHRGNQMILRRLSTNGRLVIEERAGRRGCNLYTIRFQYDTETQPAGSVVAPPPHDVHPEPDAIPHVVHETPHAVPENPAPGAGKPSENQLETPTPLARRFRSFLRCLSKQSC